MDSITQATLGAAVGHMYWQNQLGRKALIAAAMLGTLPDLDVLLFPGSLAEKVTLLTRRCRDRLLGP